ncbi:MAG: dihydroorotate dehydrogenase [archaeon]|nr:dihydroorotate dehydrogenase [archaeon]MCP8315149.1 dihydroorotate dehydrogenase [archaeon]MCP8316170.1 dihydroorotate dehydrogenase [archaeon]MCP8319763.1 dihydroorotate dehydrogenase [archaeon]
MQPDLSVEIAGFKMNNPLMLASGILGISIASLRRVFEAGAGAVITKSIGFEPRIGYDNPTLVEVHGGYLNAIGLSNPGVKEFYNELSKLEIEDLPLVVSLFGAKPSEFKEMVSILDGLKIKAYELNLSCPHVKGFGIEVGQDPKAIREVIKAVKEETKKPLFVKLSPNVTDIVKIAKAAENSGADALTIINTIRAMSIDIETFRPILANKIGGLSGPAIKPIAVRCVYEVSKEVRIPVIGCGGIVNWKDAIEFFLAGAKAIQIGTAMAYEGLDIFEKIKKGIRDYLIMKEKKSVREIIGLSH